MCQSIQNDNQGQVGIGTLIIFISMVLVAAMAAGTLINTAGSLQTQAEQTSQESTDLVSERIDIVSTVGIVNDADNGTLGEVRIRVAGAVGSDQIDLSSTTLQIIGPHGSENLIFTGTTQLNTTQSDDSSTPITNVSDIPEGGFAVQNSSGEFVSNSDAVMSDKQGQFTIILDTSNDPFVDNNDIVFGEGDSSSIDIISPSGATTRTELTAPLLFQNDGEAVRL